MKEKQHHRFEKLISIGLVMFAIGFNLWLYRLEPTAKIDPNDNTFQYALVDRTNQIWDFANKTCSKFFLSRITCHLSLLIDHWVPNWAEGYNLPYYYSHIPQILIVASYRFISWTSQFSIFNFQFLINFLNFKFQISNLSLFQYYHLIIYLLLSFFPLSAFWALRVIGLPWLAAGLGALLATQISTDGLYGLDPSSFLWRGYGLSSQLFAMIFLPLALAYSFRYFSTPRWEGWTFLEQLKIFFRKIRETVTAKNLHLANTRANWRNQQPPVRAGSKNAPADPSSFFPAVFFLFATTAGHLGIGIIAFLSVGILALAPSIYSVLNQKSKDITIKQFWSDLTKLIILAGVAIFFLSYWIVPIFLNGNYHNISVWDPIWKFDSYGAKDIVNKLFNGDLFDFGRWPVLTFLVFIGLFVALWPKSSQNTQKTRISGWSDNLKVRSSDSLSIRHSESSEFSEIYPYFPFALLFIFWLALYFGRTTWGGLIDFIPGIGEFHLSRFIVGVHLAGLFLAPIGVQKIVSSVMYQVSRILKRESSLVLLLVYSLIGLLVIFALYPQTIRYNQTNEVLIRRANDNYAWVTGDLNELLATLRRLEAERPGRILAGRGGSWGRDFRVAETPLYMYLSTYGLPVVLWLPETWSPNSDTEQFLSEGLERDYALYNIRYVVTPPTQATQPFWRLVKATSSWRLYEVKTQGYFASGIKPAIVSTNKENYLNLVHLWIQSDYPQKGLYPELTFDKNYPKKTGLPNFRMVDEANYLVPDGSIHNLFAEPPLYLTPQPSFAKAIEGTAIESREAGSGSARQFNNVTILSQESDTDMVLKAKVNVKEPCLECLIVLRQSYHPNWKATVDGKEVKPVNVFPFFLAVPLSQAGTHEVIFFYKPARIKVALLELEVAVLISLIILARLRAGETKISP